MTAFAVHFLKEISTLCSQETDIEYRQENIAGIQ